MGDQQDGSRDPVVVCHKVAILFFTVFAAKKTLPLSTLRQILD